MALLADLFPILPTHQTPAKLCEQPANSMEKRETVHKIRLFDGPYE